MSRFSRSAITQTPAGVPELARFLRKSLAAFGLLSTTPAKWLGNCRNWDSTLSGTRVVLRNEPNVPGGNQTG